MMKPPARLSEDHLQAIAENLVTTKPDAGAARHIAQRSRPSGGYFRFGALWVVVSPVPRELRRCVEECFINR